MNCMQVRADDESNYQLFYNHIEGFDFEPRLQLYAASKGGERGQSSRRW